MFCCIRDVVPGVHPGKIYCGKNNLSIVVDNTILDKNGIPVNKYECLAELDNTRAKRLCRSVGKIKGGSTVFTPAGILQYHSYQMY